MQDEKQIATFAIATNNRQGHVNLGNANKLQVCWSDTQFDCKAESVEEHQPELVLHLVPEVWYALYPLVNLFELAFCHLYAECASIHHVDDILLVDAVLEYVSLQHSSNSPHEICKLICVHLFCHLFFAKKK